MTIPICIEPDTSELKNLIVKSVGEPCIELKKVNQDTITFRTTHVTNLHITINKGKLVPVKSTDYYNGVHKVVAGL